MGMTTAGSLPDPRPCTRSAGCHPVANVRGGGYTWASRAAPRGHPSLVRDLAADVRRPGRADRGHATGTGRGEALDRPASLPARAELLHAAARPRGAAARDLRGLVAQWDGRRAD